MKSVNKKTLLIFALLSFFLYFETIEAQNIAYTPLFTNSNFTKTIDVSLAVGSISGNASVSGGSANYSIPLILPSGTNGVNPELTLSYNSMGANGPIGMGWNISGFSMISRTNKNIYFDSNTNPIDFSTNDRFVLDGERLIVKSGSYGENLSTYSKESEDFSTVTSYGNYGGGPSYFKLETKEGLVFEYGNTTDSKFLNSDNTKV